MAVVMVGSVTRALEVGSMLLLGLHQSLQFGTIAKGKAPQLLPNAENLG